MLEIRAIVYTSHTGFTARYAGMLGEATGAPVYPLKEAVKRLERGTPVFYLGWLCAGSIHGLERASRRFAVQGIGAVGMAPPAPAYTAKLRRPDCLREVPLFYLRGGYAPGRLRGVYKPMMGIMARRVTKTPAETPEERSIQEVFLLGGDWVSQGQLAPVLNWIEAGEK